MGLIEAVSGLLLNRSTDGPNSEVVLRLAGDEVSDVLNFVLKDEASNRWWDHYGSNFAVPLKSAEQRAADADLPKQLCDTWAWIRWDYNGRPNRSEAQANEEYETSVEEMEALLEAGRCAGLVVSRYVWVGAWLWCCLLCAGRAGSLVKGACNCQYQCRSSHHPVTSMLVWMKYVCSILC